MAPSLHTSADLDGLKKRKREKHDQVNITKPKRPRAQAKTNGVNGTQNDVSHDLEAEIDTQPPRDPSPSKPRKARQQKPKQIRDRALELRANGAPWKVSEPMGGRMADIDPIFTPDEQHLLIAYNTSIQVYSTSDSLLVRRIPIPIVSKNQDGSPQRCIIATALSQTSPHILWVGCSDGCIWRVDWTTGSLDSCFQTLAQALLDLTVQSIKIGKKVEEILFTSERLNAKTSQLVAYHSDDLSEMDSRLLHTNGTDMHILRSAPGIGNRDGALVAAAGRAVLVGTLESEVIGNFRDLEYTFYSLELDDEVCSLDTRCSPRRVTSKRNKGVDPSVGVLDLLVGCARGSIQIFDDILARLQGLLGASSKKTNPQPRKHHWHRRAVYSAKWSRDGNYFVSGGLECVLVLWQTDTSRREFLPHLSAAIENIVVSPTGSSYALHLDDNSTMVISTAEMKPTSYVSGLQSLVFTEMPPKGSSVRRVWQTIEDLSRPLPAAINPADPSRMLLCVGNGQQASMTGRFPSVPLIQTFDLTSFQSIAKQPLSRTNPTDNNLGNKGYPITEPTVTHLTLSRDAGWLASVDEWQPPRRDLGNVVEDSTFAGEWSRDRREIYLKFWRANTEQNTFELVTRVNEAHFTQRAEAIFDLAADPNSARFATVGDDGVARLWTPKMRQRDGLTSTGPDGQPLYSWSCTRAITLGESSGPQDDAVLSETLKVNRSGALVFSEDSSTLFVAFGNPGEGVVYIIDSESGEIRDVLHGMINGDVRSIQVLSSCLIVVSKDLKVYDIVTDELRYGIHLKSESHGALLQTHIAVDPQSQTFALAVPHFRGKNRKIEKGVCSDLAVFSLDDSQPLMMEDFPSLITNLLPTVGAPGFLAIDSAAQVWSVLEGTQTTSLAQPLADLRLDVEQPADQTVSNGAVLLAGDAEDESDVEQDDEEDRMEVEPDEVHQAVVAPQKLTDIFDAAPAFAMPPIEEIFYQVTGLLSTRPVATA